MDEAQKIYFDESGFTGDNLLNKNQTVFSYGSVATSDDEARDFVRYLQRKYNIQNGELKGRMLVNSTSGKKAVNELLETFKGRIKASIHNKKYALAGKLFEYAFEPLIKDNNVIFYNINFHKFISNYVYMEFILRESGAEELFEDFEAVMRGNKPIENSAIFSPTNKNPSPMMEKITEFLILNSPFIKDKLDALHGPGYKKWILDLTNTSLHGLLAHWGQKFHQIDAYCDSSKPIEENQELYNDMIGREDKLFTHISGKSHPLTFNLKREINFVDSKIVHGVQIADVVAAVTAYICEQGNNEQYAVKWRDCLEEYVIYGSVFPDFEHIDLNIPEVQLNALVMFELVERSRAKVNLTERMEYTIKQLSFARNMNPFNG